MKKVKELSPFKHLCMSIGNLPSAYIDSMSYYETLLWLIKFLQEQVIPTVNNNGEAVEELQGLYVQLKTYVDTYFTNLDVQDEINNKLDSLVADGTISRIINDELLTEINKKLDLVFNKKIIIIGDSYDGGATPEGEGPVDGWGRLLRQKLGFTLNVDAWENNQGGTGFATTTNWLQLLQAINTGGHDNEITDIIVCGGYNDRSANEQTLINAIINFKNYVDTKYPNAKIHIGFIGNTTNKANKYSIGSMARLYADSCKSLGIHYLTNVEYVLHNYYQMFTSDGIHPNQKGQNAISDNIIHAWLYGSTDVKYGNQPISASYGIVTTTLDNGIVRFSCPTNATFSVNASAVSCSGSNAIELTTIEYGYIIGNDNSVCGMPVHCYANLGGGNYKSLSGTVTIEGNKLKFYPIQISDDGRGFYSLTCTQLIFARFSGVFESIYN